MKKSPTKRTELQRLLSKRGVTSRSKASVLIKSGKVKVNGRVVKDPLLYVSLSSKIEVDDIQISEPKNVDKILIAFNKPKGVVTTTSDEKGRKTVYDFLPEMYQHLKAIGRLDMASTGLLLFTNDNILANKISDPKSKIAKTYVVTVSGSPSKSALSQLESGIVDEGEKLTASKVVVRKASQKETTLIITLTEGKNREIRRMCKSIGHEVIKLKRISIGNIELGDLEPNGVRVIDFKNL